MSVLQFSAPPRTIVKYLVVGIGGAGCNVVNRLVESGLDPAHCVAVDTSSAAGKNSLAKTFIQIGSGITGGTGTGGDPKKGQMAAEAASDKFQELFAGTDMVFIALGAGGGTGTGAGPIIAKAANQSGALTIGVVSKPFGFEGKKRMAVAEKGIGFLKECLDSIIIVPNNQLLSVSDSATTIFNAFKRSDEVLRDGINAIVSIITEVGDINIDFADVRTVMTGRGISYMGTGEASGENAVIEALKKAIESPLLETSIDGARAVLFNVTGGQDLAILEVDQAARYVCDAVSRDAIIIFGTTIKESFADRVLVTVIACGLGQ